MAHLLHQLLELLAVHPALLLDAVDDLLQIVHVPGQQVPAQRAKQAQRGRESDCSATDPPDGMPGVGRGRYAGVAKHKHVQVASKATSQRVANLRAAAHCSTLPGPAKSHHQPPNSQAMPPHPPPAPHQTQTPPPPPRVPPRHDGHSPQRAHIPQSRLIPPLGPEAVVAVHQPRPCDSSGSGQCTRSAGLLCAVGC